MADTPEFSDDPNFDGGTPAPKLPAALQTAALGLTPEEGIFVRIVLEKGDAMVAAVQAKLPNPENLAFEEMIRRTLDSPQVQAALVAGQQAQAAKLSDQVPIRTTKESLESRYYDIMDRARATPGAFGAEIAAGKVIASMNSLLKSEVNVNIHRTVEEMSDRELQRIAKGGKPVIDADFTTEETSGEG
jgi:hypothetical protein